MAPGVPAKNHLPLNLDSLVQFSGALESTTNPGTPPLSYINCFSGDPEEGKKMFLLVAREALIELSTSLKTNESAKSAVDAL